MNYLTYEDLYKIHLQVVEVSGGGTTGILNPEGIKSILEQIKNNDYYPEIENKIAYLFFSLNKNHCFEDGNKRIAVAACVQFLNLNGYLFVLERFIREMENISIHVAASKIKRDLLEEIITSIVYEDDFSEDLKIKIIESLYQTSARE